MSEPLKKANSLTCDPNESHSMKNMDLTLVRTFLVVWECQGITKASKYLNLSQSAISLQLQKLEEFVGEALLIRDSKGFQLTKSGESFLGHAKELIALQERALHDLRSGEAADSLRIGIPDVFATRYLPKVLPEFIKAHPGVHPHICCDVSVSLLDQMNRGDLDFLFIVRHQNQTTGQTIAQEDIVWVCSHSFDWMQEPLALALYPQPCIFRAYGLEALSRHGRSWKTTYTTQSTAAIDVAIDQGYALSIKARRTIQPHWKVLGEEEGFPPLRPVELQWVEAPGTLSEPAATFRRLFLEAVQSDTGAA